MTPQPAVPIMFRGGRPKLSLNVPTTSAAPTAALPSPGSALSININAALAASAIASSPRSAIHTISPCSPSSTAITPLTQAARNAVLNQRGFVTLQVPSFAYKNEYAADKSILKRCSPTTGLRDSPGCDEKNLRFNDVPKVECVSPLPPECHGGYQKLSRDERRWRRE